MTHPAWPQSEDDRTLNLLGALALGIIDRLNQSVATSAGYAGETPAALVTLGTESGISVNGLRKILNLSHPGTVRLLDRLQAEGLVERRSGTDGRTLALFLTDEGNERRQAILATRQQQLHIAMSTLTSNERKQLAKLLDKMLVAMTTNESQAVATCRLCDEDVCPGDRCPIERRYRQIVKP